MTKQKADKYFLNMLPSVAAASKDTSTKVAAIIVGPNDDIRSTGFNGFPRGINDDVNERHERPEKYFWFEHAERNAIYNAARHGTALDKCRIYVSAVPCMDCARGIIQSGIKEVICSQANDEFNERWKEQIDRTKIMFDEAGVVLTEI
jgi:dCMP deaminase